MDKFEIKNRAGVTIEFIKVTSDIYDDGHYKVFNNTGNDYYVKSDAYYIREIHKDKTVVAIDPEGGLPIGPLCIGDELNGMIVKEIKVFEKAYPINEPVSNIIVTFE